jgi:hypothetical protein
VNRGLRKTPLRLALAILLGTTTRTAHADGVAWAPFSLGGVVLHDADANRTFGEFAVNAGLGYGVALSKRDWTLGALGTSTLYATRGFDLGGVVRFANTSFSDVSGDPGVAFDLGLAARLWGDGSFGRAPVQMRFTYVTTGGFEMMLVAEPFDLWRGIKSPSLGLYAGFDYARLGRGVVSFARGMGN